jgi:hypothetical protein
MLVFYSEDGGSMFLWNLGTDLLEDVIFIVKYNIQRTSKLNVLIETACYLLHDGFLLGLFFEPEGGGDMLLQNVSWLSTDYTALHPRGQNSS